MQVSLEEISSLGRKLTITIPNDKIQSEVNNRLNSLKGSVKVDGFRPGKVPLNIVKQRHGAQVHQEVLVQEMQNSYQEAIVQEKLNPVTSPTIEPQEAQPGEDIVFVATLDIYPEFALADFTSLEVSLDVAEVEDKNVDDAQQRIQKQRMNWLDFDGVAEKGNRITIDFTGRLEGEEFEGGKAEDFAMVLGESNMIAGFEDPLFGMKVGEEKTFAVTFPEDYNNQTLAGKETEFDTKVKKLEQGELPEINDEFLTSLGIDGTLETMRIEIRNSLEMEAKKQTSSQAKQVVMKLLLENHELELPQSMISNEISSLREQAQKNYQMEGAAELGDDLFMDEAKQRVKLGLIVGQIVREHKLQVNPERVNAHIQDLARQYPDAQEVINYYTTNNQARAQVESLVMEEQVVDSVIDKVKVTENKIGFDEITKNL
jgi:trigger factor